jgi:hypothetical protein
MAAKSSKAKVKLGSFAHIHKLSAGVSVLSFLLICAAGWQVDAPRQVKIDLILFRAFVVLIVINIITRIVVRVLKTYEEMNSGEAQTYGR